MTTTFELEQCTDISKATQEEIHRPIESVKTGDGVINAWPSNSDEIVIAHIGHDQHLRCKSHTPEPIRRKSNG